MKNNGTAEKIGFSEISTIRDILMGEHISEFQGAIGLLEDKLNEMKSDFEQKLENAKDNYDSRLEDLQKVHDAEISSLKKELLEKTQLLEKKVDADNAAGKQHLSSLFANLSDAISK